MEDNQKKELESNEMFAFIEYVFVKIFVFFKSILKNCLKAFIYLIDFLIFFVRKYKYLLLIVLLTISSLSLYKYFFKTKDYKTLYFSSIELKVGSEANKVLYVNVDKINNIIDNKKYKALASFLNIPQEDATKIKSMSLKPFISEEDKLKHLNNVLSSLSTEDKNTFLDRLGTGYIDKLLEEGKKQYPYQLLTIYLTQDTLFSKIGKALIHKVQNDKNLTKRLNFKIDKLRDDSLFVENSIEKINQVHEISLKQTNRGNQGNINPYFSQGQDKEDIGISAVKERENLRKQLGKIKQDIFEGVQQLEIIRDFDEKGNVYHSSVYFIAIKMGVILLQTFLIVFMIYLVTILFNFVKKRASTKTYVKGRI